MLVITGTQRAGTSMVAKMYMEMGYDLGGSEWDDEAKGGYENVVVCKFYNNYIGDPSFPYDDFPWPLHPIERPFFLRFSGLGLPVIKFSYLLMNPVFVSIWRKFRPPKMGDKFLIMRRHFGDVCRSKMRMWDRFQHDSVMLKQSAGMLEANWSASLSLLWGYGYETATCYFPECTLPGCEGYLNEALSVIAPDLLVPSNVWREVVDGSLIHFRPE